MPARIQRKRSKGWRMPEGAIFEWRRAVNALVLLLCALVQFPVWGEHKSLLKTVVEPSERCAPIFTKYVVVENGAPKDDMSIRCHGCVPSLVIDTISPFDARYFRPFIDGEPDEWSDSYIRRATGGALLVVGIILIIVIACVINKKTSLPRDDRYRPQKDSDDQFYWRSPMADDTPRDGDSDDEITERVARAIQQTRGPRENWERAGDLIRDLWLTDARAAIAAYTAALEEAGFVIVPKEPTNEMIDYVWKSRHQMDPRRIYRAMIAAAPTLPSRS